MLKHALDSNLKEYIHKAVGVCGVSAGGFGGTRAHVRRIDKFFGELLWMSKVLRYGRENVPI